MLQKYEISLLAKHSEQYTAYGRGTPDAELSPFKRELVKIHPLF